MREVLSTWRARGAEVAEDLNSATHPLETAFLTQPATEVRRVVLLPTRAIRI